MDGPRISGWASDAALLDDFLAEPNLCHIATVDDAGDPHVVPAWYCWDGMRFWVGAQAGDAKVAHARRTGRAAIEIDSDIRRKRGVLARGRALVLDGLDGRDAYLRITTEQVRRYQPDRPAAETAARMAERGTPVAIEITPESMVSWGR
ncbi:MAG: pyridoxamine 5'-phosphate oxidase family protein [Chloroflexota bacterium]|mgnify:FL=1